MIWKETVKHFENARCDRHLLLYVLLNTFFWGVLSHGYVFFNSNFSHDSLTVYANVSEELWKVQLGRWFVPVYRLLVRGQLATPLLIGFLSLLFLGFSIYFTVKIFDLHHPVSIALLSAIYVSNLTVTATAATYIYEWDFDMLAVLFSSLAAYFWKSGGRRNFIVGAICVTFSLGIYQSYISVVIVLIIIHSLIQLSHAVNAKRVFCDGMKGVIMIAMGGILYVGTTKLACHILKVGLSSQGSNSLYNMLGVNVIKSLTYTYSNWWTTLLECNIGMHFKINLAFTYFLLGYSGFVILSDLVSNNANKINYILCAILLALFPMGSNIACFLNNGSVHELMQFSVVTVFMIPVIFFDSEMQYDISPSSRGKKRRISQKCSLIMLLCVAITVWCNIRTSNSVYLKKDLEHKATLSFMTRVIDRIENTPGYVIGETPVIFVGASGHAKTIPGFEAYNTIIGVERTLSITAWHPNYYKFYFEYIMNHPINVRGYVLTLDELGYREQVNSMPIFPAPGSIEWADDNLIVKLENM